MAEPRYSKISLLPGCLYTSFGLFLPFTVLEKVAGHTYQSHVQRFGAWRAIGWSIQYSIPVWPTGSNKIVKLVEYHFIIRYCLRFLLNMNYFFGVCSSESIRSSSDHLKRNKSITIKRVNQTVKLSVETNIKFRSKIRTLLLFRLDIISVLYVNLLLLPTVQLWPTYKNRVFITGILEGGGGNVLRARATNLPAHEPSFFTLMERPSALPK